MAEGLRLFPPMRWKFLDEEDIAAYGDDWWLWDERALSRMRSRELIELEELAGMPVKLVIKGLRGDDADADTAAMWISMHLAGSPVARADFNPRPLLADWEIVPAAPLDSGKAPEPDSDSSEALPPSSESATS